MRINAISTMACNEAIHSIETTNELLQALCVMDAEVDPTGFDQAHGVSIQRKK